MTVKELIEKLQEMSQDAVVYVDNHQMHEWDDAKDVYETTQEIFVRKGKYRTKKIVCIGDKIDPLTEED